MSKFENKVVVITGGTRGIGRGIAEAFLAEGAKVVVNGRSTAKGEQALKEMNSGDRAHFIAGDVTRQADCESLIDQSVEYFGRLDILINNAGGSTGFALVVELTDEAWCNAQDWILSSAFWCTRRALRYMLPNRWGRIVNMSSVDGCTADKPTVSHYITFKHALNGFTKAVAFENGETGITCNAIVAGAVETDLMMEAGRKAAEVLGISYEEHKQSYAQNSAIKRLNTVEEIAAMALLLCSDVGGGITGALIDVNGGSNI